MTGQLSAVGIGDVAALAAERAEESERRRGLPAEVMRAVVEAGFARHFVPRALGGDAGTFADLAAAVTELGRACPSTAWCASVTAHLGRMAAFMPAAGLRDVWGDGPDSVVVGSLIPGAQAEAVAGGWLLTGKWPYISAVEHADWALLCATVSTEGGSRARMFAVPRSDFSVSETWNDIGMRGTGSHTLVADGVHVPEHRVADRDDLLVGRCPGSTAVCHTVPLRAVNALSFATPALGAARGMLAAWRACVAPKCSGEPSARLTYENAFARSAGEVDAAELMLDRSAQVADDGGGKSAREESRNLRDCALATDFLLSAADRLFRSAGTSAHSGDAPLQRFWRDMHSMSSHVVLRFDSAASYYAGERLPSTTD